MSGTPFRTKFTIGLLTIEPCPQNPETIIDIEHKSADVIAIEQAARDAIKAKKKAKKVARQKSRSTSPSKNVSRGKSPVKKPAELEAKKLAEEKEAARKKAEEEEAAKLAAYQEELARQEAEEEALLLEAARQTYEEVEPSLGASQASMSIEPARTKPKRRISFFPVTTCVDNEGLDEALYKYGNDVPFDWEKPEWTKEHVNLRHTSTINNTYGWDKPDWTRRSMLKKTMLGDVVKQGADLTRPRGNIDPCNRTYLMRRHSLSGRDKFDIDSHAKEFGWEKPLWARKSILRTTGLGDLARQGLNLEIPVHIVKGLASGATEEELGLDTSYASLNASQKNVAWEKPEWAVNPSLKLTETGMAVRQGYNLAMPVRKLATPGAATLTDSASDIYEKSPHASFANLNASQKNIAWETPEWATKTLKKTSKGELMKETGTLAKPIEYGFQKSYTHN